MKNLNTVCDTLLAKGQLHVDRRAEQTCDKIQDMRTAKDNEHAINNVH